MDGCMSTLTGSGKDRYISKTVAEALQGRRDHCFRNRAPSRSAFTWTRSHACILIALGIISQVSLIQASETRASGLEKRAAGNSPNFVNDPSLTRAVEELVTEFSSGGKNPSPEKVAQYKAALSRCVSSLSGSALGRRPTCPVSITTLTTVKDEIRDALSGVGSPNTNDCVPNFQADRCEEYVKLIQCGVNHMRNGFLRATSDNAMTVRQAEKWRNEYYKLYERHQRDIDNVKQSVSDEYKLQIDSLKTTMHALQQQIDRYAERIKNYGPEVIANRIRDGQISSAKAAFEELKKEFSISEDRLISQILDNAYDLNQLERTVEFIEAIPTCAQEESGYQALIDLMGQRGHSGSPEILIVSKGANSGCSLSSGLKGAINSRVQAVIGAWAQRILSGNYDQIKDFARNHAESFRQNLGRIISSAYANQITRAERVIKFTDELGSEEQRIAYPVLFRDMVASNSLNGHELVMLAYRVKELLNQGSSSDLEYIKSQLPSSVKALIFDSYVRIRSKRHDTNYLGSLASGCGRRGCKDVQVFTCQLSDKLTEKWIVHSEERGRYFRFTIDKDNGRALCNGWLDKNKHHGFGGHEGDDLWEVIPVDGGAYVLFKNKSNGKVLDSNDILGTWLALWGSSQASADCSVVSVNDYVGNNFQKWEIK